MRGWRSLRARHPSLPSEPSGYILGIDEVGVGCWAGPIVVCGVLAPPDFEIDGLRDSKSVAKSKHPKFNELIRARATRVCLVAAGSEDIDEVGVHRVKKDCMKRIVQELGDLAAHVIVDGDDSPGGGCLVLPKADDLVQHVSAASIVAKLAKDRVMSWANQMWPGYGFDHNSGYRSDDHVAGIKKFGVCPIHRRSYRPIQEALKMRVHCVCIRGNTQWTGPECAAIIYQK